MGKKYLTDSNAVIDYLSGKFGEKAMTFMNKVIDDIPNISVITKIEILGYETNHKDYKLLFDFASDSIVIGLIDEIVNQTIEIRKIYKIKTPDAIIAASAMVNKLTLITRNTKDFEKIEGLEVLNPYDM